MLISVSSTILNLPEEKEALLEVVNNLRLILPEFECFIPNTNSLEDLRISKASAGDIFIAIYKDKYADSEEDKEKKSVAQREFEASAKSNKSQILLEYHDDSNRENELVDFLESTYNFGQRQVRMKYSNKDDLKQSLLATVAFEILQVNHSLTSDQKRGLQSLIEEDIRYREFLTATCKFMDMRGFPKSLSLVNPELTNLFISSPLIQVSTISDVENLTTEAPIKDGITEHLLQQMELNISFPFYFDSFYKRSDVGRPASNLKEIQKPSKLVILGPPGIGKTSHLNECVIHILNEKKGLFPIIMSIKDFSLALLDNRDDTVISYLTKRSVQDGFSDSFFIRHLNAGSCVIMFDGLDEVYDGDLRKSVSKKLEEFSARFEKNNVIVVTSRFLGYLQARINGFDHYVISRLTKNQIVNYIDKWYEYVKSQTGTEMISKDQFKQKIFSNESISHLATTPLFLVLLCLMSSKHTVSNNREAIFRNYIDTMISLWDMNKPLSGRNNRISPNMLLEGIKAIAFFVTRVINLRRRGTKSAQF